MMSVFTQEQATAMMLKEERNIARQEGRQEGIEFGMERGMKQNSIVVAKNMKNDGMSIDMIIKYTGLSEKDLETL